MCREAQVTWIELNRSTREIRARNQKQKATKQQTQAEALSDHKVEAVTVLESIPDRIRQDFSSVFVDKG